MATSILLAKLFGAWLLIKGLVVLKNRKTVEKIVDGVLKSDALMFMGSMMATLIGLLVVLTHNVWEPEFAAVITVIGWLILIKGIVGVFFPDSMRQMAKSMTKGGMYAFGSVVSIVVGAYLLYTGFGY
ncbi:hypothetical protein CMO96_01420 [Candidatus Woesebacteria bacterium]|nr:hypothetical protein [Candidatus Woesebacteria bacterium]|tara:strand:+ start:188 stop:571 length:384 start_codon:yes stop_codon:yes gene_type:complete